MVDDIRPRVPKLPVDKDKQTLDVEPQPMSDEPAFVPPDQLADQEDGFISLPSRKPENDPATPKKSFKDHFKKLGVHYQNATKKQKIIGSIIIAVLLLAGGGGIYALQNQDQPVAQAPPPVVEKKVEPPKTTEPSRLTGIEIPIELNKRPITSIQIENSPDARPQSGLKDAGVVYEAIAEGGITRFNASFLETQPDYIGPIRSVRPYYAVLAAPFDPIFVHAGGSGEGLAKLSQLGLKDLDHGANGKAFMRVSDRFAPHNLYSSTAKLDEASRGRGYNVSDVKSFARKAEKPGQPATANKIDINISSALYNVHYDYDPASNSYKRFMGGSAHSDHKSGIQITPKVVVTLAMSFSQSGIYSVYQTNGTGAATIFQDGQVIAANWTKASDKEQYTFTDAAGKPIELNAGQTWFTLIKAPDQVRSSL